MNYYHHGKQHRMSIQRSVATADVPSWWSNSSNWLFGLVDIVIAGEVSYGDIWIMDDKVQFFGRRPDGTKWFLTDSISTKICESLRTAAKFARIGGYPIDEEYSEDVNILEYSFQAREGVSRSVAHNAGAEQLSKCSWETAVVLGTDVRIRVSKTDP
jgi:hypothetical protein